MDPIEDSNHTNSDSGVSVAANSVSNNNNTSEDTDVENVGFGRRLERAIIDHAANFSSQGESDYSDSDQEKPKSIIRKSSSANSAHGSEKSAGSSSRKSILIRRHSEPSSPEDACSSSRGSECLSGHGGDSSTGHLASTASTTTTGASVHVGSSNSDDVVTILVENTRFIVNPALFRSRPETMLGRMFSLQSLNSSITRPNERGEYEITESISSICFRTILDYYKEGVIHCPETMSVQELRDACDYFLIPFNTQTVKCQNLRSLLQEISNQGAKEQFAVFIESLVMPVLVQIAGQGDREGHIVVLAEEDIFEWDLEYPPPLGEEPSQIIRNNALYRFFRYVENRDVAKVLLKERGFKKVRLGVEGFPTTLEKVKKKAGGRIEVIYNYIQRTFISMSWEEEDAKSRHVDFQCIRLKTKTNPAPLAVAAADTEQDVAVVQQAVVEIANDIPPSVIVDGPSNAAAAAAVGGSVINPALINDNLSMAIADQAESPTNNASILQGPPQVVRILSSTSPSRQQDSSQDAAVSDNRQDLSPLGTSLSSSLANNTFSSQSGPYSIAIGGLSAASTSSIPAGSSPSASTGLPLFQQVSGARVSPYRERIVHLAASSSNPPAVPTSSQTSSGVSSRSSSSSVVAFSTNPTSQRQIVFDDHSDGEGGYIFKPSNNNNSNQSHSNNHHRR